MYINIASVLVSFGIPTAIMNLNEVAIKSYFFRNKSKVLITTGFIIFCIALIIFFNNDINYLPKILCCLSILFQACISIIEAILIKCKKEKSILLINIIYTFLFLSWHYYQAQTFYRLEILLCGLICLQLLKLLLLKTIKPKSQYYKVKLSENAIEKHIRNIGFNDTLNIVTKWLDKLILVYFIAPDDFALFFNGTFEVPFIGLLASVTGSIVAVKMAEYYENNKEIASLYSNGFRLLSNIIFPIFFFLIFFRNEFFSLLFNGKYEDSIPIFLISVLILPIRINSYTTILQCKFRSDIIIKGSLMDFILALFLMVPLYHFWGLQGVAFSIVFATYIQSFYYIFQSAKILNEPISKLFPYKNLTIKFILIFVSTYLLTLLIQSESMLNRLAVATLFTVITITVNLLFHFYIQKKLTR